MITFRALELSDVDFLYEIENDESLWLYGSNTAPYSRFALEQHVLNSTSNLYDDSQLRLVAMHEGHTLGLADLFAYDAKHHRAEVGISLHPSFRGKGFGTLVLQQLVAYTHRHLHLHQLYAYVATDNVPALQAFLSAGFTHTATLSDWISTPQGYRDAAVLQYLLYANQPL